MTNFNHVQNSSSSETLFTVAQFIFLKQVFKTIGKTTPQMSQKADPGLDDIPKNQHQKLLKYEANKTI